MANRTMQQSGKEDRSVMLKHSSRMKSLAMLKSDPGQLKGLVRKKIVGEGSGSGIRSRLFKQIHNAMINTVDC